MRYSHRTSLSIDDVLEEATRYFGARLTAAGGEGRTRSFAGPVGEVRVSARAEGGHYTLITLVTGDVGESEIDRFAKRFLSTVHGRVHHEHQVRGAY
ncbi:MAG TPA: hypothetical protein VGA37_02890 [Gemmatimonadales bacterium]